MLNKLNSVLENKETEKLKTENYSLMMIIPPDDYYSLYI